MVYDSMVYYSFLGLMVSIWKVSMNRGPQSYLSVGTPILTDGVQNSAKVYMASCIR